MSENQNKVENGGEYVRAGYQIGDFEEQTKEQETPTAYEKLMHETNKQIAKSLSKVEKDISAIRSWVLFFGVIFILGLILGGCNMIMSF